MRSGVGGVERGIDVCGEVELEIVNELASGPSAAATPIPTSPLLKVGRIYPLTLLVLLLVFLL